MWTAKGVKQVSNREKYHVTEGSTIKCVAKEFPNVSMTDAGIKVIFYCRIRDMRLITAVCGEGTRVVHQGGAPLIGTEGDKG